MTESASLPANLDFNVWRGDTFRRTLTVTDGTDPWDFTDASIKFYIRDTQDSAALITLQASSGVTIVSNVVTIELTDTQTGSLGARSYLYEVEYTDSNDEIRTWISGKFIVSDKTE